MSGKDPAIIRKALLIIIAVAVALALAAIYGIISQQGKSGGEGGEAEVTTTAPGGPPAGIMARGAMRNLVVHKQRRDISGMTFQDGAGKPLKVGGWKGKVLLINFWATWCPPCRREMPDIGKLQEAFDRNEFLVVAASEDRRGYDWAKSGIKVIGGENLLLVTDKGAVSLRVVNPRASLPTTILVDRQGRLVATLIGPAAWNSPEAQSVIKALLAEK